MTDDLGTCPRCKQPRVKVAPQAHCGQGSRLGEHGTYRCGCMTPSLGQQLDKATETVSAWPEERRRSVDVHASFECEHCGEEIKGPVLGINGHTTSGETVMFHPDRDECRLAFDRWPLRLAST